MYLLNPGILWNKKMWTATQLRCLAIGRTALPSIYRTIIWFNYQVYMPIHTFDMTCRAKTVMRPQSLKPPMYVTPPMLHCASTPPSQLYQASLHWAAMPIFETVSFNMKQKMMLARYQICYTSWLREWRAHLWGFDNNVVVYVEHDVQSCDASLTFCGYAHFC